jgi:hypothetical protein
MMNGIAGMNWMMFGIGVLWLPAAVVLILAAAALVKYLLSKR